MKIGEALQEVNVLKQQLIRLQRQRKNLFNPVYSESVGSSFEELSQDIENILRKINNLKLSIMKANVASVVKVELDDQVEEMSLMEAILKVTEFKSELSELESISASDPQNLHMRMMGRQMGTPEFSQPLNERELEEKIRTLENKKRMFNLAIQGLNWKIKLDI